MQIQIASVSGHVKYYIFKICQIVGGTGKYLSEALLFAEHEGEHVCLVLLCDQNSFGRS